MTLAVVIAFTGSLLMTPLAKSLAWRLGAVSHPDGVRRMQARPTPLWGGASVYLAMVIAMAASAVVARGVFRGSSLPIAFGLSAGVLCLVGCYDDRFDMRARWKLLGQILATIPVVAAGYYVDRLTLGGYSLELGWLAVPVTMAWLVFGINALNLLDGMDGLASLVGIATSLAVAAIAASHGNLAVVLLALVVAGAIAGFLLYNLPPARIYLGDCGSMLIGFAVAFLALRISTTTSGSANIPVLFALMFVPLTDTSLAVVRRWLNGSSLMVGDREHVHHRLLDRGLPTRRVLAILGGLCLTSGGIAWWAATEGAQGRACLILVTLLAVLVNRKLVGHGEWRLARRSGVRFAMRLGRQLAPVRWSDDVRPVGSSPAARSDEPIAGEIAESIPASVELAEHREEVRPAA